MVQSVQVYRDVANKISRLQTVVNDFLQSNIQSGSLLGANLVNSTDVNALNAAMVTLMADRVTLLNTIPAIVVGN